MSEIKMTTAQKNLKILLENNKQIVYSDYITFDLVENGDHYVLENDHYEVKRKYYLKENIPFETVLEYQGFERGRSALNIKWKDSKTDIIYYSGMSLLSDALRAGKIEGNKLKGTFFFKKQGTSILLNGII